MPDPLQIIAAMRAQEPVAGAVFGCWGESYASVVQNGTEREWCAKAGAKRLYTRDPAALDALQAEVERLRRQKSEARHSLEIERAAASELVDAVERLTRELAEARADAELLDWVLRNPETSAEELEDAAGGEGAPRENLERRRAALAHAAAKEQSNG